MKSYDAIVTNTRTPSKREDVDDGDDAALTSSFPLSAFGDRGAFP